MTEGDAVVVEPGEAIGSLKHETCDCCGAVLAHKWPAELEVTCRGMAFCASCSPFGKEFFKDWSLAPRKLKKFRAEDLLSIREKP